MLRGMMAAMSLLCGTAQAQVPGSLGVTAGLSLDVVPAQDWDVAVRVVGGLPMVVGRECPQGPDRCRTVWPAVTPEVAFGFPFSGGVTVDVSLAVGVATGSMYTRGWWPHVQVMPQLGRRWSTTGAPVWWAGGYVSKSLSDEFVGEPLTNTGRFVGSPVCARLDVAVPWDASGRGALRLGLGGQLSLLAMQAVLLSASN